MSFILSRHQVGRLIAAGKWKYFSLKKPLNLNKMALLQSVTMYTRASQLETKPRPKPWNWKKYGYNLFFSFFDKTTKRFDDNTKVIVVDGNIAAGKSELAQALAKEFGMKYFPETTMDDYYINSYGQDLREFDSRLPICMRTFDIRNFYENPNHVNVAKFQINMLILRHQRYLDALTHLFNTGEGVILDRSVYSDFVFLETSSKFGYISKGAQGIYNEMKTLTFPELMKPHLVIYLDVPTDIILNRIKKRNRVEEVTSKVITPEYIETINDVYKNQFLVEMDKYCEVLVYNWSEFGDAEVVAEDIERIDFDRFDKYDKKLKDWRQPTEWDWAFRRKKYTNTYEVYDGFRIVNLDVPEVMGSGEDFEIYEKVVENAKGWRYAPGYDPELDKGIWFK